MSGTLRSNIGDAARRIYRAITRGTLVEPDDKPKMQTVTIRDFFGDRVEGVEHWHPYGFTTVPNKPDKDGEAEALVLYVGGNPDHPVVLAIADRRHRPKDLKAGDVAHHDHRKQMTLYHKDGITKTSPMTITHNVVDKDGKVLSTIVQHKDGKKITIETAGSDGKKGSGAFIELDGPNITKRPGKGGKLMLG